MERQPKISVVVPVYKVERYLKNCVDSILAQTYQDFELILVDDGSPDTCPAMCDEFAAKDSRIRVVHKQNGGLSMARASGVEVSRGEYIAFVDSDDFIHPHYLELLLSACMEHGAQVSVCRFQRTEPEAMRTDCVDKTYRGGGTQMPFLSAPTECISGKEANRRLYKGTWKRESVVAWCKLCRRELFAGIPFPNVPIYEDEALTYILLYRAEKVTYLDAELYYYRQNPQGIMSTQFSAENLEKSLVLLPIFEKRKQFYDEMGEKNLSADLLNWEFYQLCRFCVEIPPQVEGAEDAKRRLHQEMRRVYKEMMRRKETPWRYRIKNTVWLLNPEFFYKQNLKR